MIVFTIVVVLFFGISLVFAFAHTNPSKVVNASDVAALINVERVKTGASSLGYENVLADVARAHSEDMAARNFFSSINPDQKTPADRVRKANFKYNELLELIERDKSTPDAVARAWLSGAAREQLLSDKYGRVGVGASNKRWTILLTD